MKFQTHKYPRYQGFCLCPKTSIGESVYAFPCTVVEDQYIHCPECKKDFWVMSLSDEAGINVWCDECDKPVKQLGENHYFCSTCTQEKAIIYNHIKSISCGRNMAEKHHHIYNIEGREER